MKPEYKNAPDYPEHGIRDVRDITVHQAETTKAKPAHCGCSGPCGISCEYADYIEAEERETDVEMQNCEGCLKDKELNTMLADSDGNWFCPECVSEMEKEVKYAKR